MGLTWLSCQTRSLYLYFDRVESEANPVDKLSRGVASGPWRDVARGVFLVQELEGLAASCGGWRAQWNDAWPSASFILTDPPSVSYTHLTLPTTPYV